MKVSKKLRKLPAKAAAAYQNHRRKPLPLRLLTAAAVAFFAARALLLATFPLEAVAGRPASLVVTDRSGAPLRGFLSASGEWRLPVPLSEMGSVMPRAVVALEDRRFYFHGGVDIFALLRAALQNAKKGRAVSGASTITSQTVRLAVARPRTHAAKFIEFAQASALEFFMDKDRILETYLNSVPFGGNIRGVEAAARSWFGKPAKELSLAEAALLAGLLRGPAYYRPDRRPERAKELRDRIIDTLLRRGVVGEEEARRAKKEPLPRARLSLSGARVQAAEAAARFGGAAFAADGYGRFRSTIDSRLQRLVLSELLRRLSAAEREITACALLVENDGGAVRAYVGNAREGTEGASSWVDCAQSERSPGSLLKPFIYALAFQSGKASPASMLCDVPDGAGGGTRNFDRLYRGPVSARAALAESLNAPAVEVFRRVGAENVLNFLHALGFSHLTRAAAYYGESLALGGCGVTPLETARAYLALASGGSAGALRWGEEEAKPRGPSLLAPAAAFMTLDILKDVRRNLPAFADADSDGKRIAFKTGTSYGLRDAWCAAVTKKYTLVVWFGDPRGRPHRSLVGLKAAAPAAAAIMLALTEQGEPWFAPPPGAVKKELCPLSGAPRNQYCPKSRSDYVIEGVTDDAPCVMHAYSGGKVVIKWPQKIERWRAAHGGGKDEGLEIISPKDGASYVKRGSDEIPLAASGGRGEIFWVADGVLIEKTGEAPAWKMSGGRHTIAAADEYGNAAEAEITVREPASGAEGDIPLLEESGGQAL